MGCNAVNILYQYKNELPGINWTNLVLDGANLADADLSGKNFSNTRLKFANLDNVKFNDANFTCANLRGVRIEETTDIISIATNKYKNYFCAAYDDLSIKNGFLKTR